MRMISTTTTATSGRRRRTGVVGRRQRRRSTHVISVLSTPVLLVLSISHPFILLLLLPSSLPTVVDAAFFTSSATSSSTARGRGSSVQHVQLSSSTTTTRTTTPAHTTTTRLKYINKDNDDHHFHSMTPTTTHMDLLSGEEKSRRRIRPGGGRPTTTTPLSAVATTKRAATALFPNRLLSNLSASLPFEVSIDSISLCIGFVTLFGYHFQLWLRETSKTNRKRNTWRSVQADTRERWSNYVQETEGYLYAIQTMRNAITAMTFLSTTVLSLLTVIVGRLWEVLKSTNVATTAKNNNARLLLISQMSIVTTLMLTSAYQFLQSARLMTHAGFMFPVETTTDKVKRSKNTVGRVMRKSQNAQWFGLRFLYLSFPILSWIVGGPIVFGITSILLRIFLGNVDKVPIGLDDSNISNHNNQYII